MTADDASPTYHSPSSSAAAPASGLQHLCCPRSSSSFSCRPHPPRASPRACCSRPTRRQDWAPHRPKEPRAAACFSSSQPRAFPRNTAGARNGKGCNDGRLTTVDYGRSTPRRRYASAIGCGVVGPPCYLSTLLLVQGATIGGGDGRAVSARTAARSLAGPMPYARYPEGAVEWISSLPSEAGQGDSEPEGRGVGLGRVTSICGNGCARLSVSFFFGWAKRNRPGRRACEVVGGESGGEGLRGCVRVMNRSGRQHFRRRWSVRGPFITCRAEAREGRKHRGLGVMPFAVNKQDWQDAILY